jgi:hypothetical protein
LLTWEHSNETWSTIGQGDMDKLTFKNIEKYLKNHAKIENETENKNEKILTAGDRS